MEENKSKKKMEKIVMKIFRQKIASFGGSTNKCKDGRDGDGGSARIRPPLRRHGGYPVTAELVITDGNHKEGFLSARLMIALRD